MASLPSERKTSNGCKVAVPVPRKTTGFRDPSECIAAIDFGTTNCSLAYSIKGYSPIEGPTRLVLNHTHHRVPTAILFKPDGTVDTFGYEARTKFSSLAEDKWMHYAYFEQIKMDLQHDEGVSRELTVFASNGKEYYILDVIAQVLKYLKDQLISRLKLAKAPVTNASNFDWVITVPAIWRARGKQMMREAGYKAGLCSEETCACLKDTRTAVLPTRLYEKNPDKLFIVLEPEAALVYCENMRQYQQQLADKKTECCVIVDIGGGTVDISAVKVSSNEAGRINPFEVVYPPTGSSGGGSAVNKQFLIFLKKLVNDPELAKYFNPEIENVSEHRADLNELLNDTFEKQKALFTNTDEQPDEQDIRLPLSFLETYCDDIDKSLAEERFRDIVKRKTSNLRISSSVMQGFFKPVVKDLIKEIKEVLANLNEVHIIYLVGGFGGTTYILNAIEEKCGKEYTYCIPIEPEFAVVRGAVLLHQNPEIISTRRADATYGFETMVPFNKEIHCDEYRVRDRMHCQTLCDKIFATLVQRGDIVSRTLVYCTTVNPHVPGQHAVKFDIYSSYEKDVWYITGKRGKGDKRQQQAVYKLCSFDIPLSPIDDETDREVELYFDFSHTEIQLRAYDTATKEDVKAVIDFLSMDPH